MRLYMWKPQGFGDSTYFVMAESLEAATAAVEAKVAEDRSCGYGPEGWGTDYYVLTIVDAGVVLAHDNS